MENKFVNSVKVGMEFYSIVQDCNARFVVRSQVGKSDVWKCECIEEGYEHIKPFNEKVIIAYVNRRIGLELMMSDHDLFYANLKPGQIVHYCNGHDQFVRCEVVFGEINNRGGNEKPGFHGNVLKPIGFIGNYQSYDLPHRLPNGEICYPSATKMDHERWQPNCSFIWENPECSYRKSSYNKASFNPSKSKLIDLSVPPMTMEQQEQAKLWKAIEGSIVVLNDKSEQNPIKRLEKAMEIISFSLKKGE